MAIAAPLALNVSPAAAQDGVGSTSARGIDPDATWGDDATTLAAYSAITNCDETQSTRPFYVQWGHGDAKFSFKREAIDTSTCISEGSTNINSGTGSGLVNGAIPATLQWHFEESPDNVSITVSPETSSTVVIDGAPEPLNGSPGGVWVFGGLPWPAQAPVRFFSPSSFWNVPLAPDAPLDPSSAALSAQLRDTARQEVADGIGPWIETDDYTTPLYTVPADQPTVRVQLDNTVDWRQELQAAFAAVPIPPGARPARGSQGQMTIWQPATDKLWEFWQARRDPQGNWQASFGGAIQHVSQSPGYYTSESWPGAAYPYRWGATASGLPVIGGTILLDELARGRIDHALALNIPQARAGVFSWPAQRTDGLTDSPGAIPYGARFRLDPDLDIASLNLRPLVRMIAEAAQRYGMVVRNRTGAGNAIGFLVEDTSLLGAADPFWTPSRKPRPDGYLQGIWPRVLLAKFPWQHLQLLQMNLCNKSSPTCPWPR